MKELWKIFKKPRQEGMVQASVQGPILIALKALFYYVGISAVESRTKSEPNPSRISNFEPVSEIRTFGSRRVSSIRRFENFGFKPTRRIRDSKKFEGSTALVRTHQCCRNRKHRHFEARPGSSKPGPALPGLP